MASLFPFFRVRNALNRPLPGTCGLKNARFRTHPATRLDLCARLAPFPVPCLSLPVHTLPLHWTGVLKNARFRIHPATRVDLCAHLAPFSPFPHCLSSVPVCTPHSKNGRACGTELPLAEMGMRGGCGEPARWQCSERCRSRRHDGVCLTTVRHAPGVAKKEELAVKRTGKRPISDTGRGDTRP